MKQRTAPQLPAVANARACSALGLMIAGSDFKAGDSTATNLSTRRLGMRTT